MAVAIGPGPELFQNPRRLPARRIRQRIAQRLRPGGLLLGIAGIPVGIIFDALERPRLLWRRLTLDIGTRRHRKRDVDAGTVIGILRAECGRDRRTTSASLS